jgi:TonB family protein
MHNYYMGLVLTGKGFVPKQFSSDAEVLAYVTRTQGAIGYVSNSAITEGVKVLVVVSKGRQAERVLISRVEPEYPEVLRPLRVAGMVRLQLVVSAKGSVESATVVGGNPILADAAVAAVKKWVYAPAPSASTVEVSIPFRPKH